MWKTTGSRLAYITIWPFELVEAWKTFPSDTIPGNMHMDFVSTITVIKWSITLRIISPYQITVSIAHQLLAINSIKENKNYHISQVNIMATDGLDTRTAPCVVRPSTVMSLTWFSCNTCCLQKNTYPPRYFSDIVAFVAAQWVQLLYWQA